MNFVWISCMRGKSNCFFFFHLFAFWKKKCCQRQRCFCIKVGIKLWRLSWMENAFNAFVQIVETHDRHQFVCQLVNWAQSNLQVCTVMLKYQKKTNNFCFKSNIQLKILINLTGSLFMNVLIQSRWQLIRIFQSIAHFSDVRWHTF